MERLHKDKRYSPRLCESAKNWLGHSGCQASLAWLSKCFRKVWNHELACFSFSILGIYTTSRTNFLYVITIMLCTHTPNVLHHISRCSLLCLILFYLTMSDVIMDVDHQNGDIYQLTTPSSLRSYQCLTFYRT